MKYFIVGFKLSKVPLLRSIKHDSEVVVCCYFDISLNKHNSPHTKNTLDKTVWTRVEEPG